MPKYLQGHFRPKHPAKYRGDLSDIIYRSSWEMAWMCRMDKDDNVVWWASEETVIAYVSPVDQQPHRYYVDFAYQTKDGITHLVEIKPAKKCEPPKQRKRVTKGYLAELAEYAVNQAKWTYARAWCEDRGYKFDVLTEHDLGIG